MYLLSVFLRNGQVDELKTSYKKKSYKQLLLFSNAQTHTHTPCQKWFDRKRHFSTYFFSFSVCVCLDIHIQLFFTSFFSFCLWFVCHQIGMAIVASSVFLLEEFYFKKEVPAHDITTIYIHMQIIYICIASQCCLCCWLQTRQWNPFTVYGPFFFFFACIHLFLFCCDILISLCRFLYRSFFVFCSSSHLYLFFMRIFIPFPAHFIKIKSPIAYLFNFINNWCVIHIHAQYCVISYDRHNDDHTAAPTTTTTTTVMVIKSTQMNHSSSL